MMKCKKDGGTCGYGGICDECGEAGLSAVEPVVSVILEPEMDENVFVNMLQAIADNFTAERQKQEPYKELFKAGSSYTGLLRQLETQMMGPVLDACDVMKERFGVTANKEQFHMLLALPLLVKIATADAKKNEGSACCVDKAYFLLSEQLLKLGEAH